MHVSPGLLRKRPGVVATGAKKSKRSGSDASRKKSSNELPEVLYRFTDSTGNSATVVEDGVASTITIVTQPAQFTYNPLSSFEERDIDPTSSDPVLPTTLLATKLPRLPSIDEIFDGLGQASSPGPHGISGSRSTVPSGSNGNGDESSGPPPALQSQGSSAAVAPSGYGNPTSSSPPSQSAHNASAASAASPAQRSAATAATAATILSGHGGTLAGATANGTGNPTGIGSSATGALNGSASLTVGHTITIRREPGPNPVEEALLRIAHWRRQLWEWFRATLANITQAGLAGSSSRGLMLPAPRVPYGSGATGAGVGASGGGDAEGMASSSEFDGSAVSEAAGVLLPPSRIRGTTTLSPAARTGGGGGAGSETKFRDNAAAAAEPERVTGSEDDEGGEEEEEHEGEEGEEEHEGGKERQPGQVIDPLALGTLVLAAAAAAVAALVALASSAAAAAAVTAAAAALPAPAPVNWVQLNPVAGVAPEASLDWHHLTWTEICNLILEPLSRMFQKWSYAALPVKIVFVLASSIPLVMVFGSLYYLAVGGRGAGQSFGEALIKIHCILNRMPGTNMVRESNAMSFLVVNFAFFTGLFTFAIFLGIVSDEVKSTFRSIKTGTYPVRVRDHVLVINWSHHTIPLLRQYDLARQYAGNDAFFRRPVVLLSDAPKQDMDNEIAERLKSSHLEVITRTGSPAMLRNLATVAAARAHTIIVMHPGGAASHSAAEAAKASTAMALAALAAAEARAGVGPGDGPGSDFIGLTSRGQASTFRSLFSGPSWQQPPGPDGASSQAAFTQSGPQYYPGSGAAPGGGGAASVRIPRVLFQMPDEVLVAHDPVTSFTRTSPANVSGNMQALSITDASVIDRFTCQAAVQPGMLRIWASVLQHGPHSVKALVVPVPPQLVGSTFGKARCQYPDAVLIGILREPSAPLAGAAPSGGGGGGGAPFGAPFGLFGGGGGGSTAAAAAAAAGGSSGTAGVAGNGYGQICMNIKELDSRELTVADQLVMFAPARVVGAPQPSPLTEALYPPAAAAAAERLKRHGGYNAPPKRVIMAGFRWQDVPDVAAAFADSAPDGSQLTFILPQLVADDPDGQQPELPGSAGACRLRYVDAKGVMISLRALHEAGIKTADAIVLRPPIQEMERWCSKKPVTSKIREADAMVMAGLVQLQDAVIASGRTEPPHVVARLNRFGSTETALRYFEMLSPPQPQRPTQPQLLQPDAAQMKAGAAGAAPAGIIADAAKLPAAVASPLKKEASASQQTAGAKSGALKQPQLKDSPQQQQQQSEAWELGSQDSADPGQVPAAPQPRWWEAWWPRHDHDSFSLLAELERLALSAAAATAATGGAAPAPQQQQQPLAQVTAPGPGSKVGPGKAQTQGRPLAQGQQSKATEKPAAEAAARIQGTKGKVLQQETSLLEPAVVLGQLGLGQCEQQWEPWWERAQWIRAPAAGAGARLQSQHSSPTRQEQAQPGTAATAGGSVAPQPQQGSQNQKQMQQPVKAQEAAPAGAPVPQPAVTVVPDSCVDVAGPWRWGRWPATAAPPPPAQPATMTGQPTQAAQPPSQQQAPKGQGGKEKQKEFNGQQQQEQALSAIGKSGTTTSGATPGSAPSAAAGSPQWPSAAAAGSSPVVTSGTPAAASHGPPSGPVAPSSSSFGLPIHLPGMPGAAAAAASASDVSASANTTHTAGGTIAPAGTQHQPASTSSASHNGGSAAGGVTATGAPDASGSSGSAGSAGGAQGVVHAAGSGAGSTQQSASSQQPQQHQQQGGQQPRHHDQQLQQQQQHQQRTASPAAESASTAPSTPSGTGSSTGGGASSNPQQQQQQQEQGDGPQQPPHPHSHLPNLLHEGPLAAMQAVMMGSGLPALPIGNEGTNPLVQQSAAPPVTGVSNGGSGSGSPQASLASAGTAPAATGSTGSGDGGATGSGVASSSGSHGNGGGSASSGVSGGGVAGSSGSAAAGGAPATGTGGGTSAAASGGGGGSTGAIAGGGSSAAASGASTTVTATANGSSNNSSSSSSGSTAGSTVTLPPPPLPPPPPPPPVYDKRPIIRNPEIFLADDLIGALLTQVAAQPNYTLLVSQLIRKDGVELYLRNPAVFNIAAGERLSFAELSETTRLLRQVALGVVRADGRCCLVPKPHEVFEMEAGDQILVLSDDYRISRKK